MLVDVGTRFINVNGKFVIQTEPEAVQEESQHKTYLPGSRLKPVQYLVDLGRTRLVPANACAFL